MTPELVTRAREMVAAGTSQVETARILGVDRSTIHLWIDPDSRAKSNRRRRARRQCQERPTEWTWEDARMADGPAVAAWLDQRGAAERLNLINPNMATRLSRWRRGSTADFFAIDRILTALGLHPSMLPETVWRAYR